MTCAPEHYGHVALQLDQIKSLTQALHLALEAESTKPLQGNVPGALSVALERAADDALSLFEAYYHPATLNVEEKKQ
ncbi:MAG: hypothetical protein AAGB19_08670 [Cyanobacteria bacterium P01_F01_bin.3]